MLGNTIFWAASAVFASLCIFALAWGVGCLLRRRRLELEAEQEDNKP